MEFERTKRRHTHMDIAPLVDVVFQLLLFFMLTSHFLGEPAIKVRLPESQTAQLLEEGELLITLSREGQVYLGEERVEIEALGSALNKAQEAGSIESVRIRSDRDASVGLLMRVVDEVRGAGIRSFAISTESLPRGGAASGSSAPEGVP